MSGEIVLVTGAASGIGRACAVAFANAGAKAVVLADLDEAGGHETAREVARAGAQAEFVPTDVSRPGDVERLIQRVVELYGRLDVAVNNAGIEGRSARLVDQTEADWDRVLDVNAKGVFLCMRAELPQMVRQSSGAIVNMASIAGIVGFTWAAPYVASKHAIIGLTKTAAIEVSKKGVRVNAVAPGIIKTPMIDRVTKGDPQAEAGMVELEPVGRLGTPDEIANAVLWLASDRACFVTGETLVVDGGYVAR
ncbi:MAG: SDR family oxidoreductase [Chloroflexota bacterium]|nr:SDR family oxidoreductase [Chloroflexota bacterium]MDE3102367.1 SDR family oxidoreductase [Chloroflexota bacterium]